MRWEEAPEVNPHKGVIIRTKTASFALSGPVTSDTPRSRPSADFGVMGS